MWEKDEISSLPIVMAAPRVVLRMLSVNLQKMSFHIFIQLEKNIYYIPL